MSGCAQFRLFLEFVLLSLRIDDFVSVSGGGCDDAFDGSETICCFATAVDCALTFQGHANGGALQTISCNKNNNNNNNNEEISLSISKRTFAENTKENEKIGNRNKKTKRMWKENNNTSGHKHK